MSRLATARSVAAWASLPLLAMACWLVPGYSRGLVAVVGSLVAVLAYVIVARTHTVKLGMVLTMFALGVPWAFGVAFATIAAARVLRMDTGWAGSEVALASFIEEPGKLLPLLAVALLAPGRARRFAATDWALLGYASGAAFAAAEDFVRRAARRPGLLDLLFPDTGTSFSLNPWSSGSLTSLDGLALYPGHQISAANTAMAVALGIVVWRAGSGGPRALSVVPAMLTLLLALADHAAYNADVGGSRPLHQIDGFPLVLEWVWILGLHGRGAIAINVGLLIACLAVDAHRRYSSGDAGRVVGDSPTPSPPTVITSLPAPVRAPVAAVWMAGWYAVADAVVILAALAPHAGASRHDGVVVGRLARQAVLAARADAMTVTTPGREPGSRRSFWLVTLATSAVALAIVVGWGASIAQAIGRALLTAGDGPRYFAGLLASLGTWWDSLGFGGQTLVTAGIVALVIASGGSMALALGLSGIAAWTAGHGHGLADLLRNPREAFRTYLTKATPADFIWDTVDFLLTFVPGSVLGKAAGSALRGLPDEVLGRIVAWRQGRLAEQLIAQSAPNAARAARLASLLRTAELANPLADSLRTTGRLPSNYITKARAEAAGWAPGRAVGTTSPGAQIGGDLFRDDFGSLPAKQGRIWHEADVGLKDTISRSKQPGTRLVYSNDGLAYITDDHYETLYQLPNWR